MDRSPRHDLAALAAWAAAVLLAPLAVVALRLFPPLVPDEHGVGWLLPLAGAGGVAALAVATLALLERGLRRNESVEVARAAALAFLGVGLGVATLRSGPTSDFPESVFPAAGLAPAAIATGVVLLVAQLARGADQPARPPLRPIVTWVALFVAIEALAAAAVLLPAMDAAWWSWLLGLAAALVAASAVPGPMLPAGLTAAGLAALAASRVGSLEVVVGIVAVAAGALAYARPAAPAPAVADADAGAEPANPRPVDLDGAARDALAAREESMRLARELRGTIEELMHARRTIEQQRTELAQAATVDPLTGVATRRAILERLRIEAAEARRYQHPVALVLLDLDDFAALNHEHGLAVGDEVLREVALRLRLRTRSADALGRVGGDSFLALLPHTDETGAATFADALRGRLLSRPIETSAGELVVRISIGVAFTRADAGLTDEELLAAADEALASARAAGGNRIAFDRAHGLIRLEERRARDGA